MAGKTKRDACGRFCGRGATEPIFLRIRSAVVVAIREGAAAASMTLGEYVELAMAKKETEERKLGN
jgi:hypothetical protein